MMSRWETMAANLPIIQQRLIALNELHQQGKIFDRKDKFHYHLIQLFNSIQHFHIMKLNNKH